MLVYDLEIYPNLFVAVFYDIKTDKWHIFQISCLLEERKRLWEFIDTRIKKKEFVVGYNNVGFDDQLLYHFYKNPHEPVQQYKKIANDIIKSKWGLYNPWEVADVIPRTIDLMKVNNFGRFGKSVSLKQLEFMLREYSIQDLPIHHESNVNTLANINKVIKYCKFDVSVTTKFLKISKPLLLYRKDFGNLVGLNIISDSEVSLAKKTITKLFSEDMGMTEKDFKLLRTYPEQILVKDIIQPVSYVQDRHNELLDFYKSVELVPTVKSKANPNKKIISLNKAINYTIDYPCGLKSVYGAGGIHGCVVSGIYTEDKEHELVDIDFGSYYPHLVDRYKQEPRQLKPGLLGNRLMTWFKERSTKYPKKTHFTLNYALKIIMNLCYGQMGSEYSPLYDPQAQLGVCVNGMLQVTKLTEIVMEMGARVLYQNTDGILIRVKREDKAVILDAVEKFADSIDIPIETLGVKKLVLNDVNNFILVDEYDGVKEKGLFETYDTIIKNNMLWKDASAMIVPLALKKYFVNNVPVEHTIYNANNIFDFFYGVKGSARFEMVESSVENNITALEPELSSVPKRFKLVETAEGEYTYELVEQRIKDNIISNTVHDVRMLRYYAATEGSTLTKLWKEGTKKGVTFDSIEANTPVIVQQTIRKPEIDDYLKNGSVKFRYDRNNKIIHRYPNLNREWYIKKCYDTIYNIVGEPKIQDQISLEFSADNEPTM